MRFGSLAVVPVLMLLAVTGRAQETVPEYHAYGPDFIDLVGNSSGVPDPRGSCTFQIRDLANQPVPNAKVEIDFTNCHDVAICRDQADPAVAFHCSPPVISVSKYADANGTVTFDLVGYATAAGGAGGSGLGCAVVRVNSYVVFGTAYRTFTACDRTGGDGVNIGDLPAILQDWGSGTYVGRSDFNHSGTLSIMDVAYWLRLWGGGGSVDGCAGGAVCP